MKRLLLVLALLLCPGLAHAQCNGVFPAKTICGNNSLSPGIPGQVPQSALTGIPGGSPGQIEYNNAGSFGGFTASGDATINTGTGAVILATVNSNIGTFAGLCVSLTANGKGLLTAVIKGLCSINAQTTNYSIATSDCGGIVTISGGPFTATLPAASGFSNGCIVKLCNINANNASTHATRLSGFPASLFARLYMGQCLEVTNIAATSWQATVIPGRFKPTFTPTLLIDTGGSDTNDGLISNAAGNALRHINTCVTILQAEYDLADAGIPICGPTGGQIFVETSGDPAVGIKFGRGGTGIGVIYIIGQGGAANIRTTGSVVIEEYDFAGYLILAGLELDCSVAGSHPCYGLFIHQQNGVDLSSAAPATASVRFVGGGATDLGLWCDGPCRVNSATAPVMDGTYGVGMRIDQSSTLNLNAGLTVNGSFTNVLQMQQLSLLQWSGTLTLGGGNSITGSLLVGQTGSQVLLSTLTVSGSVGGGGKQWTILNNALLCNGSATTIPGAAGVNTSAGAANGIIAAATSGNCFP